ncbi:MAG: hypothetical protein ABJA98_06190 [Acidobacteriota bacterium]
MRVNSSVSAYVSILQSRAGRMLLVAGSALVVSLPVNALAQSQTVCGPEIKVAVAKALSAVDGAPAAAVAATEAQLYEKYKYCAQDAALVPSSFVAAARECGAAVSNLGSLFYEEMPCAGYDPQRRQFAAPVKIKQVFGFGGAPLPGSREFVLHCVADAAGTLQPVGRDSVHLADALAGQPTWQFAVIVNATENLQVIYPMNGATRRARSILSWNFRPPDCNYTPIWGNALNYMIRLDQ